MTTPTTEQAMAIQIAAEERLERAQRELRMAEVHVAGRVSGVPLRYTAEATRRYRAAQAELDAAQAAYDAAQDFDCPEE